MIRITVHQKLSVIGMLPVPEFFFLRMEDLKFKGTYAHYIIKVGLYHYYIILPEKNADLSLSVHSSEDNAVKLLR